MWTVSRWLVSTTAVGLGDAAGETGSIDIDAPVQRYIPDLQLADLTVLVWAVAVLWFLTAGVRLLRSVLALRSSSPALARPLRPALHLHLPGHHA